jgi:hypothetical protein
MAGGLGHTGLTLYGERLFFGIGPRSTAVGAFSLRERIANLYGLAIMLVDEKA